MATEYSDSTKGSTNLCVFARKPARFLHGFLQGFGLKSSEFLPKNLPEKKAKTTPKPPQKPRNFRARFRADFARISLLFRPLFAPETTTYGIETTTKNNSLWDE